MSQHDFPLTQGALIRQARIGQTQAAFAAVLGITQGTLSRYESEKLGAPPEVINHCLRKVAGHLGHLGPSVPVSKALELTRAAVLELEQLQGPAEGRRSRRKRA